MGHRGRSCGGKRIEGAGGGTEEKAGEGEKERETKGRSIMAHEEDRGEMSSLAPEEAAGLNPPGGQVHTGLTCCSVKQTQTQVLAPAPWLNEGPWVAPGN